MKLRQMVYSYVFATAILRFPKPQQEPQTSDSNAIVIDGIGPPSGIQYTSKRVHAEALPVGYGEARLEITLASTVAGTCCVPWLKPCFKIDVTGTATTAPWPAAFQMYSDFDDGYLTQTSLRKYRHVDVLLRYVAAERAAFADVRVWKAHLKLLTSLAQMLGTSEGALRDPGLDVLITADDDWEAQTCTTRLEKVRVEPVLNV